MSAYLDGRQVHWLRLLLHCLIRRHHRVTFWFAADDPVTICRECRLRALRRVTDREEERDGSQD